MEDGADHSMAAEDVSEGASGSACAVLAAVDGSIEMSHPLDPASPPPSAGPLTADSPPSPMAKALSSPHFAPNGGLGLGALSVAAAAVRRRLRVLALASRPKSKASPPS